MIHSDPVPYCLIVYSVSHHLSCLCVLQYPLFLPFLSWRHYRSLWARLLFVPVPCCLVVARASPLSSGLCYGTPSSLFSPWRRYWSLHERVHSSSVQRPLTAVVRPTTAAVLPLVIMVSPLPFSRHGGIIDPLNRGSTRDSVPRCLIVVCAFNRGNVYCVTTSHCSSASMIHGQSP